MEKNISHMDPTFRCAIVSELHECFAPTFRCATVSEPNILVAEAFYYTQTYT